MVCVTFLQLLTIFLVAHGFFSCIINQRQFLLTNFLQFVKTQFQTNGQTIRVDNGTKLIPLHSSLQNKGIEIENSCIHTPQQNGVVKRKQRHILNVACSLIFQSNVPLEF